VHEEPFGASASRGCRDTADHVEHASIASAETDVTLDGVALTLHVHEHGPSPHVVVRHEDQPNLFDCRRSRRHGSLLWPIIDLIGEIKIEACPGICN
jgi:hypothetical protein